MPDDDRARRCRLRAFAETTADPLKAHALDRNRPMSGTLDAYQGWFCSQLHNQRHIQPIEEINVAPGYQSGTVE